MSVVTPQSCPQSISTPNIILTKMEDLGVDVTVVATFDLAFSQLSADVFLNEYLVEKLNAREIVVGHDFAFGHKRAGTAEWLSERVPTHIHAALELEGARISSSRIRECISGGRVAEAARMLGRDYSLTGIVTRGQRLGTELGVPTANLQPVFGQVLPAAGIYAGRCSVDGKDFAAAISVGFRPTIPGAGFAVEAHFMDYAGGDLYGRTFTLEFVERLRDELNFGSLTELQEQMGVDIENAREALVHHG
jgi:riboflavin kinase/FMN adenylyltransferase